MLRRLSRPTRLHLLAAVFYAALAFIILSAIVLHSGALVAGYDYFNYNWNFWWIRYALGHGLNVYLNNMVMAPHAANFGYHALTAVWYPVWAILEPLIGTLHAMNVIIFLVCFLNGYCLFVLLRRENVAAGLALVGGAMLQASPVTRYFYYNTHINLMDWFWLPLHILLWQQITRAVDQRDPRRALMWGALQGVGLWGVGLTDLQFPIFVGFLLAPYALWSVWRSTARGWLVAVGLVAVAIAGALLWFAGPLPYMVQFKGTLTPGSVDDRPGIPFPRGYFSLDPVWWMWNTPTLGGNVIIAVIVSLVAGVWLARRRVGAERWFWFVVMLPPLILSMGPAINLGETVIPMPFRVLYGITNGMFRMPWRLAPIFVTAAVLFVGKTWSPVLKAKYALPVLAGAFLLIAWDVRLFETAPLQPPLPPYTFYSEIGRESGPSYDNLVVLEVPTGAATGEVILGDPRATQLQFYGMLHHKRTLNGFISRAPIENFWPINTDDPLLAWLGQRRYLEPTLVEPELRRIIQEWPVGYIVVHQDMVGRNTPTPQEIVGYFNNLTDLLCPVWVEGDAVVYRTSAHPDGCLPRLPPEVEPGVYQVDIGSSGDERYIGWGWHWPESVAGLTLRWAGEYPQSQVYVDLPPGDYRVSLAVQAFWQPRMLRLLVNGVPLGEAQSVGVGGLQTLSFSLPATVVGSGQHLTLTLDYDAVVVPKEVGQSGDPRRLAVAVDWITFQK